MVISNLIITYYKSKSIDKELEWYYHGTASMIFDKDNGLSMKVRITSIYGTTLEEMKNNLRLRLKTIAIDSICNDKVSFKIQKWLEKVINESPVKEVSENKFLDIRSCYSYIRNDDKCMEFNEYEQTYD